MLLPIWSFAAESFAARQEKIAGKFACQVLDGSLYYLAA
jgi:hypothetical protein